MLQLERQLLAANVIGITALDDGERLTFSEVLSGWRADANFVEQWTAQSAAIPFEAYCFETPPLATSMLNTPFECVFVESPALAGLQADAQPFQQHFRQSACVAFPSLGKDAMLVAPCPTHDSTCYTHLAAFLRSASKPESNELWRTVARTLDERLSTTPLWLSTAGLGVSWLHVRLDTRPKYYRHRAYASPHYWTNRPSGPPFAA